LRAPVGNIDADLSGGAVSQPHVLCPALSSPSPSAEFGPGVVFFFIHYVDKNGMRHQAPPFNDIEHISSTRASVERQAECMARQHLLPNGERNMMLARWKFEPCRQAAPWTLSVDEMNASAGRIQDRPF
jgi:hypothetical protein